MPSNIYENKNEFRLYDVEGMLLSPNEYIVINEPDGFRDFNITIERDPDKHGLFYEFGGEDELLGFDMVQVIGELFDPYEFILAIVGAKGIDAKIQFEFLNNDVSQYRADLDFESLSQEDYKISVNARRVLLGDLFRTRIETPVDFTSKQSIDGDSITGIDPVEMFLHGKQITQESILNGDGLILDGFINPTDPAFSLKSNEIQYENGDRAYNSREPFFDNYEGGIIVVIGGGFFINKPNQSNYVAKINFNYDIFLDNVSSGSFPFIVGYATKNFGQSDDELVFTEIKEHIFPSGSSTQNENFNRQFILTPDSESGIEFYIWYTFRNQSPNFTSANLSLTIDDTILGSTSNVYNLFDSTNHILESITNQQSVLESSFLSSEAYSLYQTNGYNIRQFQPDDSNVNTAVKTDFKTQFEKFLQPVFGLGYSIYEDNGVFKLLMERYSEFYKSDEIDYIDTVQDGTYFREYDKEIIYNELKVGYKDFPKSTDENKSNNLDEFNTEHLLLTPIQSVKKKKDYVSDVIASGYKIENQRREQFNDVPSDTVSDDDKLFVINGFESNSYEPIVWTFGFLSGNLENNIIVGNNNTYFDIRAGDILNFPDSVDNTGNYTVESVSVLGDDFIITVTESVTLEFITSQVVINSTRLRAYRNEEFGTINNVISPATSYNLGLNPKYMLKNHSLIINSGLNPKSDTETIKVQDIKLNAELECQFSSGEGQYNLNPETTVKMDEDVPLSNMNNYKKLFTGFLIKFTARLTYERLLEIRNACLNQATSSNFGFLRVLDPFGVDREGFLMSLTYNPLSEQAEFVLREKFNPEGGQFNYDLDFGIN